MRWSTWAVCALALAQVSAGCGVFRAGPRCESADTVLATSGDAPLTCAEVERARSYVEALAAREVPGPDRANLEDWLVARFQADPTTVAPMLDAADAEVASFAEKSGLEAAEARGTAVFAAMSGRGPLGDADALMGVLKRAIGPWSTSRDDALVLTEMDIEGWIRYASLCREVQGAGSLRLSVADRQAVYRLVIDAYDAADRPGKVAILGLGAFWPGVEDAWDAATYEQQQAWVAAAPLPPPMSATSLGYTEALLAGPLTTHVTVLHAQLGPFRTGVVR